MISRAPRLPHLRDRGGVKAAVGRLKTGTLGLLMGGEDHLKSWLEDNCPNLWSLLNEQARKVLPQGLREYLSPPSALYLDQIREKFPEFDQEYLDQIAESRAAQGKENLVL